MDKEEARNIALNILIEAQDIKQEWIKSIGATNKVVIIPMSVLSALVLPTPEPVGFNPRLSTLNLETLNKQCHHSLSCPKKDFCMCSSHPYVPATGAPSKLIFHPPLYINDDGERLWIACSIDRPTARPVPGSDEVHGKCLDCDAYLGLITVHQESITCPSCGETNTDFIPYFDEEE